ncbi:hypothetical protein Afil01_43600 [Actinorhabdospora filicis]|uniref:Uncharacterized protein n=1 Tax=Actinorhabdospora filicis TaxID=1785913 RepID=A0A9W6WAZ7_9ACTN|nr:hypothetical protein [Actinorhabdospora filicis]GLZ79553.1 hypothetical protein Afil01_43600 [Actinorhabdospora filicis]
MRLPELIVRLAEPGVLRVNGRALTMLDLVLGDDVGHRFISGWRPGRDLLTCEDGAGNEYGVVFAEEGTFAYVFEHETSGLSPQRHGILTWPGALDGLPDFLDADVAELVTAATLCVWWTPGEGWRHGPAEFPEWEDIGAGWLIELNLNPASLDEYAEELAEMHDLDFTPNDVAWVFAREELTAERVAALRPEADWAELARVARRIGYPVTGP